MTDWIDDESGPTIPGWYAIHYGWEIAEEGTQVDGDWFDGERFTSFTSYPAILAFAGPFPNKEDAARWAESHDVSW